MGERKDGSELLTGANVKAAVAQIRPRRVENQCSFAYAVLSGRMDAVQLVYDLIVGLFGAEPEDARVLLLNHETGGGGA